MACQGRATELLVSLTSVNFASKSMDDYFISDYLTVKKSRQSHSKLVRFSLSMFPHKCLLGA